MRIEYVTFDGRMFCSFIVCCTLNANSSSFDQKQPSSKELKSTSSASIFAHFISLKTLNAASMFLSLQNPLIKVEKVIKSGFVAVTSFISLNNQSAVSIQLHLTLQSIKELKVTVFGLLQSLNFISSYSSSASASLYSLVYPLMRVV